MNLLITGGAGFIGANLVLHWLRNHPDDQVINFDALTYAGNLENLQAVKTHPNYRFVLGDLRKPLEISKALKWTPRYSFEQGLAKTIRWYLDHQDWVKNITSGAYQDYYERQYG